MPSGSAVAAQFLDRGGEHRAVAVEHLAGADRRRPAATSSSPVERIATRGARNTATSALADGREQRDLARAEPDAAAQHRLAGADVGAGGARWRRPAATACAHVDRAPSLGRLGRLDHHHRVRAARDHAAGGDRASRRPGRTSCAGACPGVSISAVSGGGAARRGARLRGPPRARRSRRRWSDRSRARRRAAATSRASTRPRHSCERRASPRRAERARSCARKRASASSRLTTSRNCSCRAACRSSSRGRGVMSSLARRRRHDARPHRHRHNLRARPGQRKAVGPRRAPTSPSAGAVASGVAPVRPSSATGTNSATPTGEAILRRLRRAAGGVGPANRRRPAGEAAHQPAGEHLVGRRARRKGRRAAARAARRRASRARPTRRGRRRCRDGRAPAGRGEGARGVVVGAPAAAPDHQHEVGVARRARRRRRRRAPPGRRARRRAPRRRAAWRRRPERHRGPAPDAEVVVAPSEAASASLRRAEPCRRPARRRRGARPRRGGRRRRRAPPARRLRAVLRPTFDGVDGSTASAPAGSGAPAQHGNGEGRAAAAPEGAQRERQRIVGARAKRRLGLQSVAVDEGEVEGRPVGGEAMGSASTRPSAAASSSRFDRPARRRGVDPAAQAALKR